MLRHATEFLHNSALYTTTQHSDENDDLQELASVLFEEMLILESLAFKFGCKSGFWRRLQKVAAQLDAQVKIEEYEENFHEALRKSK